VHSIYSLQATCFLQHWVMLPVPWETETMIKKFWKHVSCLFTEASYYQFVLCAKTSDTLAYVVNWIFFYKFFLLLFIHFYCISCIETNIGEVTHIITCILIHSLLCALNFMLPTMQTKFWWSFLHHIAGWAGLV